jgi:hypothetical protein
VNRRGRVLAAATGLVHERTGLRLDDLLAAVAARGGRRNQTRLRTSIGNRPPTEYRRSYA